MHVLIIGGTRFVGYLLTWRLLSAGHKVTLFNRGKLPDPFRERVERVVGDRTTDDLQNLLRGRRFDAVVDSTAYHTDDVQQVIDLFSGSIGHYIFVSTGQVYLVRQNCPRPSKETDYDGPLIPMPKTSQDRIEWDYGIGKRHCEDLLARAWIEKKFPSTRLRIPVVHGERDHFRRLESYLWRLGDGGPLLLPGGENQPMRHVYGDDVAKAVLKMIGRSITFGKAYNMTQFETPTLPEIISTLAAAMGARAKTVSIPKEQLIEAGLTPKMVSPLSTDWMSFLDPGLAVEELGFQHEPLSSYLAKIVSSFVNHPPQNPPEGYLFRKAELALIESLL
jgi:nucleoside-diphosphate-sugar epimerase